METAIDLLGVLAKQTGERVAKFKRWPDGARALAGRLRRAATFPRKIVIELGCGNEGRRARTRIIRATAASADPAPETGRGAIVRTVRVVRVPAEIHASQ
jgi:hypothetical protein